MPRIENLIRSEAAALGFEMCGFARLERPPHASFVEQWVADGNAAGMEYIGRGLAKRVDPSLLFDGARSVVSLGFPYVPPVVPPTDWRMELSGRIAAYAAGPDYHRFLLKKLKTLTRRLEADVPGSIVRWYIDTGPVLEREWAALGGVGWFGKNTNLLNRERGSWFFLAELVVNFDLEPSEPIADHCGTCTSCLDLCPTGALTPGYRLDSRKCISYWTIEHRGWIPCDLRPQFGNWVFGCDVCQDVCPWNEKYARENAIALNPAMFPSLMELVCLDEDTFRARYRGTPVLRPKREGLVRNAAIALGNSGNPAAAASLEKALESDPSPVVRGHAGWALGQIGTATARRALEKARGQESDPAARLEIESALEGCSEI